VIVWDLCSGLGGWSEAWLHGHAQVFRFDNFELVQHIPFTHNEDVTQWMDWVENYPSPDLILASPPCLEFSQAYNAPRVIARREGRDFEPDLTIAKAVRDIIAHVKPRWWIVENVVGSIKDLEPVFGRRTQIIGPYVLWGNFPKLPLKGYRNPKGKTQSWDIGDPLRSNKRAIIPFEISQAVRRSWFEQPDLSGWS
jgi:hypothetical protein